MSDRKRRERGGEGRGGEGKSIPAPGLSLRVERDCA